MTTPDTWMLIVTVVLVILAGTAQVLINSIVLKRFANHAKRLKMLEDEVIGDLTAYCKDDGGDS